MIHCEDFYNLLVKNGIDFFTGVPDSLLKNFCAYIFDNTDEKKNIIAANEGNAVALAAGYFMATGKIGLVYMQNSGLGNATNPLTSLTDSDVYRIPALLLIGWRGEPGIKDEPQHIKQGKITLNLLDVLGIPYKVITSLTTKVEDDLYCAVDTMRRESIPFALVIKKGAFEEYKLKNKIDNPYEITREDAIRACVNATTPHDIIISTTGKASRELFEYREAKGLSHAGDFLTVGSMGHSSQIALAIALSKPNRRVICIDGDGASIMHMGSMTIIGSKKPSNFRHIVINNGAHDSVGGQPTAGFNINIPSIAGACGYSSTFSVKDKAELIKTLPDFMKAEGPAFLEIKTMQGARNDLGRPTNSPEKNKEEFMKFLQDS